MSKQIQLSFLSHRVIFNKSFGISKMTRDFQDVLRVKLERDGIVGWGETPAIPYYGLTVDAMIETASQKKSFLEQSSWSTPSEFYELLLTCFPEDSFIRAALDAAAWDWYSKYQQKPIWQLLDLPDPGGAAITNYTIGLDTPENMCAEIVSFPWPAYKLKLGGAKDLETLELVLKSCSVPLRVDANGAWSVEQTRAFIERSMAIGEGRVEMVEEPFKDWEAAGAAELAKASAIPFYADESFQDEKDLSRLRFVYKGVNIKLDKCGGLTPAVRLINTAKSEGFLIQLGCMSCSGIGLKPAIHLSGLADVLDLDAVLLIKEDAHGVYYENGVALIESD